MPEKGPVVDTFNDAREPAGYGSKTIAFKRISVAVEYKTRDVL